MDSPRTKQRGKAMDIERDVTLEYVLESVAANPDRTGIIPLAGLGNEIRMRAGETPGTYRVAVWSTGEDPQQLTKGETVTPLQFAALAGPLINKNQQILHLQGVLLAVQTEKFLKELSEA